MDIVCVLSREMMIRMEGFDITGDGHRWATWCVLLYLLWLEMALNVVMLNVTMKGMDCLCA